MSNGFHGPLFWRVIGGTETGGLLVRKDKGTASKQLDERLLYGALVRQQNLAGTRLHYKLERGEGPQEGWVSVKTKEKKLLVRVSTLAHEAAGRGQAPQPRPVVQGRPGSDHAERAARGPWDPELGSTRADGGGAAGSTNSGTGGRAPAAAIASSYLDSGADGPAEAAGPGPPVEPQPPAASRDGLLGRDDAASLSPSCTELHAELDAARLRLGQRFQQLQDLHKKVQDLLHCESDDLTLQAGMDQLALWTSKQVADVETGQTGLNWHLSTEDLAKLAFFHGSPSSASDFGWLRDHLADDWAQVKAEQRFAEALHVSWPGLDGAANMYSVDVWLGSAPGRTIRGLAEPRLLLGELPEDAPVHLRVALRCSEQSSSMWRKGPWVKLATRPLDLARSDANADPDGRLRGLCAESGCKGYVSMRSQDPSVEEQWLHSCARCGRASEKHSLLAAPVQNSGDAVEARVHHEVPPVGVAHPVGVRDSKVTTAEHTGGSPRTSTRAKALRPEACASRAGPGQQEPPAAVAHPAGEPKSEAATAELAEGSPGTSTPAEAPGPEAPADYAEPIIASQVSEASTTPEGPVARLPVGSAQALHGVPPPELTQGLPPQLPVAPPADARAGLGVEPQTLPPAQLLGGLPAACESRALRREFAILLGQAYLGLLYRSASRRNPGPPYRSVTVYRTRKGTPTKPLTKVDFNLLGSMRIDAMEPSVFLDPGSVASKPWMGFGGSFTEAAASTFSKMPPRIQEDILWEYFNPAGNMRYTLGRVHIGSCDFCYKSWICGKLADGDKELKGFSIAHYREDILPMIQRAAMAAGAPLVLLASPWSPPPWMKTNRNFSGGSLRGDCRGAWALHYVRFVEAMAAAGCNIWGLSVQNEPEAEQVWESCKFSAQHERDFVRDHLGPALEKAKLDRVKILIWDHNRSGMLERASVAYSDPEAAKYIWGLAYHWYGDARFESWAMSRKISFDDRVGNGKVSEMRSQLCFENVRRVVELRPDKHVIQTESCQELDGRPMASVSGEAGWKHGERYAMNIIADMNSGCEGWIDWNLVLDSKGGPNHAENFCLAPVVCDSKTGDVRFEVAFWYIAHFARFIRPGARRVLCSSTHEILEVTAFKNPDDSLAIVVLNQSVEAFHSFCLKVSGSGALMTSAPARSITTYVIT